MRSTTETSTATVSEYASRIGRAVRHVGGAVVEGEVQKPRHSRGGLTYFDLTDGDSTLCCKVFSRQVTRLRHAPKEGNLVQVTVERPDFWAQRGKLDLPSSVPTSGRSGASSTWSSPTSSSPGSVCSCAAARSSWSD